MRTWIEDLLAKPAVDANVPLPGPELVEEAMRLTLSAAKPVPPQDETKREQAQY